MSKKRRPQSLAAPAPEPPPQLARILCDLESPDERTRAGAVRALCPCRGTPWEVAVFPRVWAMRDDPSPIVRHAVQHDLNENPDWGERKEARRLEGRHLRSEWQRARAEIDAGAAGEATPAPHSLAWRMPRRPRRRKLHYPPSG